MAGEGAKSVARPPRGLGDSNYGLGLLSGAEYVRRGGDGGGSNGGVSRSNDARCGGGWSIESKDAMIFVKRHNCTLRSGIRVIVPGPTTS